MSDYETHYGKIKKVETDLSCEEFAKQEFIRLTGEDTPPKYCDNFIEALRDESGEFYFVNSNVYKIENNKLEGNSDIFQYKELEDNTIEYNFRFYNGGTCLSEQIKRIINKVDKGEMI